MQPTDRGPRRRFVVADAMILTAATAAAFSCLSMPLERRLRFISDGRIIDHLRPATLVGVSFIACWGLAVLVIELWPLPLRSKRSFRYPGFVACITATTGALAKLLTLLIWGLSENYRFESWYVPSILGQLIEPAAMSVMAGWITLWLTGRSETRSDWINRFGIFIGSSWIVLYVAGWAALCLE